MDEKQSVNGGMVVLNQQILAATFWQFMVANTLIYLRGGLSRMGLQIRTSDFWLTPTWGLPDLANRNSELNRQNTSNIKRSYRVTLTRF
ncbi:MAG: hypothetical protein RL240_1162 [Planctomycetota bacterium]|jgi:hypothetical protein